MKRPRYTLTLRYEFDQETYDEAREVGRMLVDRVGNESVKLSGGKVSTPVLADFRVERAKALRP